MYTITADIVTGINGLCYYKGQVVSADVLIPETINDLVGNNAISLQVDPKKTKAE